MTVLLPLVLSTGIAVIVAWAILSRRGRDPLGPRPEGALPDTRVAVVLGLVAWYVAQNVAALLLARAGVRRLEDEAVYVFSATAVNAAVAAALLPLARRGTRRPSLAAWRIAATGLLGATVVFAVQAGPGALIQSAYDALGRSPPQQHVVEAVRRAAPSDLVLFALGAIGLAPFAEEVFFRGLVLPAAVRAFGARTGLVVQALAFGSIHVLSAWETWPLAVPLAIVGWFAGWFYLRTGSLAVSIVVHATFNAINFAAIRAVR